VSSVRAGEDPISADERAQRLVGTVHGTVVAASVLAVSAADGDLDAAEVGAYTLATVVVFWLAHGWAHALGLRAAGKPNYGLIDGLRNQLPVLEAVIPPLAGLAVARLLGASNEAAISTAVWVCVGTLTLLGAGVASREGASPLRIAVTAAGCGALGLTMVALKAVVH
jgi:hypothetical protein